MLSSYHQYLAGAAAWVGYLFTRQRSDVFTILHVEAEHHSTLGVLGDVAVCHPQSGIANVEEDIDRLPGSN